MLNDAISYPALGLITFAFTVGINGFPLFQDVRDYITLLMTNYSIAGEYVVKLLNCHICQSFWISLLINQLIRGDLIHWLSSWGVAVALLLFLDLTFRQGRT